MISLVISLIVEVSPDLLMGFSIRIRGDVKLYVHYLHWDVIVLSNTFWQVQVKGLSNMKMHSRRTYHYDLRTRAEQVLSHRDTSYSLVNLNAV
jgi:hypothetical protein